MSYALPHGRALHRVHAIAHDVKAHQTRHRIRRKVPDDRQLSRRHWHRDAGLVGAGLVDSEEERRVGVLFHRECLAHLALVLQRQEERAGGERGGCSAHVNSMLRSSTQAAKFQATCCALYNSVESVRVHANSTKVCASGSGPGSQKYKDIYGMYSSAIRGCHEEGFGVGNTSWDLFKMTDSTKFDPMARDLSSGDGRCPGQAGLTGGYLLP
eukprot:365069-Chlamydomonas_euryale.AAC.24